MLSASDTRLSESKEPCKCKHRTVSFIVRDMKNEKLTFTRS